MESVYLPLACWSAAVLRRFCRSLNEGTLGCRFFDWQIAHDIDKCIRQNLSRACNSSSEMKQTWDVMWMPKKVRRQFQHMRLLSFDVEKDIGWSWEKFLRCVADYTKRKHRNRVSGAGARDEFRLHVHCHRSRCERKFVSFLTGID